jgi:hypothetical protein
MKPVYIFLVPLIASISAHSLAADEAPALDRHNKNNAFLSVDDKIEKAFLAGKYPKEIPYPDRTPYDDDPKALKAFRIAYRVGFIEGVQGHWVIRRSTPVAWSEVHKQGTQDGQRIYQLRQEADIQAAFGTLAPDAHPLAPDSEGTDHVVFESFQKFSNRFIAEFKPRLPKSLIAAEATDPPRVYSYTYQNYWKDNTGKPIVEKRYQGSISINVSFVRDDEIDPAARELQGRYSVYVDLKEERWVIDEDSDFSITQSKLIRREGNTRHYSSERSKTALQIIKAASVAAQDPPKPK